MLRVASYALLLLSLSATSCSSVFWQNHATIPASKRLSGSEVSIELFDAKGVHCTTGQVEVRSSMSEGAPIITQFKVPKFSSEKSRPTPVNYLWLVDGQDTSVYELFYKPRKKRAILTTLGGGVMLASIPIGIASQDIFVFAGTFYGGLVTSFYGGLFVDLPTGIMSAAARAKARKLGFQPSWKVVDVQLLKPEDYPPALVRGISVLGDGEPTSSDAP